jgi:hypothetical protein
MTTTLLALRCAVNIERILRDAQDRLFHDHGALSSRLFPPFVPIRLCRTTPSPHLLDRIRKQSPLTLTDVDSCVYTSRSIALVDCALIGFDSLLSRVRAEIGNEEVLWRTPPLVDAPTAFHLAWDAPAEIGTIPVTIPSTEALYLCAFEIETDATPWWERCRYTTVFSRRVTVQQR